MMRFHFSALAAAALCFIIIFSSLVTLFSATTVSSAVVVNTNDKKKKGSSSSSSNNNDETTERHMRKFNEWLGSLDPDLKVHLRRDLAGGLGYGVYTNSSVKKGESILTLPMSYVLCEETLTMEPSKYDGVDYWKVLSTVQRRDDQITLAVMTERALRSKSKFAPWIRVLPEVGVGLYLPHMWPPALRKGILPTPVRESIEAMASSMKPNFEALSVPLRILKEHVKMQLRKSNSGSSNNGKAVSADSVEKDFSLERYKWAHSIVTSRAWNIAGRKYLVPGADMFNHDYDVEDCAFDFKRDSTVRPLRSQKFTMFHLAHGGKYPLPPGAAFDSGAAASDSADAETENKTKPSIKRSTPPPPRRSGAYVELISDRSVPNANEEIFESYGDSTDSIYFQYLGFVASDIETMLVQTIAPASDTQPPHLDLDFFAKIWARKSNTNRNRRECLEMELLEPAPVRRANKTAGDASKVVVATPSAASSSSSSGSGDNNNDNAEDEEPPFFNVAKKMVHWAKRLLGLGGTDGTDKATVCIRFGEVHPLHFVFHYMTQLPPAAVLKSSCFQDNVEPLTRHEPTTQLYPAVKLLLRQMRRCLRKSAAAAASVGENSDTAKLADVNTTLRAYAAMTNDIAKRLLPENFGIEKQADVNRIMDHIIDDALSAMIIRCRMRGVNNREQCFAGYSSVLESGLAPESSFGSSAGSSIYNVLGGGDTTAEQALSQDVANLMRLRLSLQQRMLVVEAQRRIEMKRSGAKKKFAQLMGLPVDEADLNDDEATVDPVPHTEQEAEPEE